MSAFTEPLAQVRRGIAEPHRANNRHEYKTALAALARVEQLATDMEARLADARKTLEVIEEPMHFDDMDAIRDDRVRMQAAARAWLTRDRAVLSAREEGGRFE